MAPKEPQAEAPRNPQHAGDSHVARPQTVPRAVPVAAPAQPAAPVATPQASTELILPLSVVTRSDISRSLRELTEIEDYFHQAAVRGSKDQQIPTMSKVLDGLATANGLNLIHPEDRSRLKEFLTRIKNNAPVVHMSFPSEASAPFLAKILEWFRREAHPHTVLHVGLQPELAAGCLVRTTNKLFDFSFRKRFEQSKQKLLQALEDASKEVAAEAASAQVPATAEVSATTEPPVQAVQPQPEQTGGAA